MRAAVCPQCASPIELPDDVHGRCSACGLHVESRDHALLTIDRAPLVPLVETGSRPVQVTAYGAAFLFAISSLAVPIAPALVLLAMASLLALLGFKLRPRSIRRLPRARTLRR